MASLVIREAQLAAMGAARRERFEHALVAYLEQNLPDHCRALGPEGVRAAIDEGIVRAAAHGLVSELAAASYIRLMFVFGRDFDRDEGLPWARAVLASDEHADEAARVAALDAAALADLRARAAGGAATAPAASTEADADAAPAAAAMATGQRS